MTDNDKFLDTLFENARETPAQMDAGFLTRLQVQAELSVPKPVVVQPSRSIWSRLFDRFGQFSAGAGMATAMATGIILGINPPDFVLDITTVYFGGETLADLTGELLLDDYFGEDA